MLLGIAAWVWAYVIAARLPRLRRTLVGGFCFQCGYDCRSLLGQMDLCPECGGDIRGLQPISREYSERWITPSIWSGITRTILFGLALPLCCALPGGSLVVMISVVPIVLVAVFLATTYRSLSMGESCFCALWIIGGQVVILLVHAMLSPNSFEWVLGFIPSGGFGALVSVALVRQHFKERLDAARRTMQTPSVPPSA